MNLGKTLSFKEEMRNYQLLQEIGSGTYGTVYKIKHRETKEYFAVKKMSRFDKNALQEKEICNNLNHPNIIRYYKIVYYRDKIYMIMELGEQDIYQKYYDYQKHITLDDIFEILKQISQAIKYLHNQDIMHGDIKIENILFCNKTYKLCDFGISERCQFMNTCKYDYRDLKVPEVRESLWGKPTDIWGLGHTINRLLQFYYIPMKNYMDTFCEKYYKLVKLRDLCFEEDYQKRITIDCFIEKLND
jgi:serine/threonine protein kinase